MDGLLYSIANSISVSLRRVLFAFAARQTRESGGRDSFCRNVGAALDRSTCVRALDRFD